MISMKPQESPAIFPTVEKPTNLFSSKPFRKLLATIYPLVWEKTRKRKGVESLVEIMGFMGSSLDLIY